MAPQDNYFKLVALIVDIACLVICKYIQENIIGPDSFETFLNKKKHTLVHVYETPECCECRLGKITGQRLISRKQLLLLYNSDEMKLINSHIKYTKRKLTPICICKYSAIPSIDVKVVDITLANYIIQKCGNQELGIENWIEQIKDVRNEIFHQSDIQNIDDSTFSRNWTKLHGSILGIANAIGEEYAWEIKNKIRETKDIIMIPDYNMKYAQLCKDYWKHKCAEFEVRFHLLSL